MNICESGIYTGGIPIDKTSFEILSISFPINNVRVIIKNNLDYEAHKYIHLYIQCTVNNKIGIFLVQIKIQDSNDNCPTMLIQYNENVVSKSRRSLDLSYIAKITIDDKDEGINKKTKFHLHAINTVPNINTQYNPDTNYDSLIRDKTNVIVTILGVDEGTPPLATKLDVEYSMGNTCLLSHNFQEIPLKVDIDQNFGYINILSPGYYLQNEKIKQIGMEHGWILDKQIKASSNKERNEATRSRLNEAYDPILLSGSGWVPFKSDPGEWIKLSLKNVYNFHALLIQGNGNNPYWVTKFKIAYRNTKSIDNEFVFYYFTSNNIITNILNGNIDQSTVVKIDFKPIIITDTILIYPIEWEKEISIRFDYIGISMEELNYYRETCIRCETTYYCHGDGSINECARCSSDITCTKDSYEHSFGSYGQCTSCLNGYFCQKGRAKICPLNFHTNCNSLLGCTKPCKKCGSDIICNNGEIINCSFTKTDSDSKCTLCIDSAEKKCPCLDFPCYDGSCQIYNSYNKKCVECPIGMHAINQICVDIDECKIPNICWNNRCINRNSGFQCLACPYGYRGTYRDGVDIQQSRIFMHGNTIKLEQLGLNQECNDINECKEDVNACPSYTICQNEPGGFNCLKCKEGYIFNECKECVPKNFCISNKICHSQSTCVYGGPGIFMCNCNVGFAGDGFYCGKDSDLDEIPDDNLICFLDKVCFKDNAIHVPNSGQEDTDNDGIGDVDDDDIDNDGILNNYDNCIFISNFLQKNKDKDYFGNVCDKCASKASVINTDFDSDNIGDVCDKDADNDGINNTQDNCVYHSNKDQLDQDGDGVGDVCDNCPEIKNSKQTDHNFNFIGDSCDDLSNLFKLDRDSDSVPDMKDNCIDFPNSEQTDTDGDGKGNLCDSDIDNDGIKNLYDVCLYSKENGKIADIYNNFYYKCKYDLDMDGIFNILDPNPFDSIIKTINFMPCEIIPIEENIQDIHRNTILIRDHGRHIQTIGSREKMATLIVTNIAFTDGIFTGTFYTKSVELTGYIGIIFNYHSTGMYYIVMWKSQNSNLKSSNARGSMHGLKIKLINSKRYPTWSSRLYIEALWESAAIYELNLQTKLLYKGDVGWKSGVSYKWKLERYASTGHVRFIIENANNLIIDTGIIYDNFLNGGKIGIFNYDQNGFISSNLKYKIFPIQNGLILFSKDAKNSLKLPNAICLCMHKSFSLYLHILMEFDSILTNQKIYLFTMQDVNLFSIYIENNLFKLSVYGSILIFPNVVANNANYGIGAGYDAANQKMYFYLNGQESVISVNNYDLTILDSLKLNIYVGGTNDITNISQNVLLDEIRLYSIFMGKKEFFENAWNKDVRIAIKSKCLIYMSSFDTNNDVFNEAIFNQNCIDKSQYTYQNVLDQSLDTLRKKYIVNRSISKFKMS